MGRDGVEGRRIATVEAAAALVDDLEHIRSVLAAAAPTPGDVRRLSAQLRRILVEQDLVKVAGPRIGRVHLLVPDLKPIYVANRKDPIPFFASGGASIFGVSISSAMVDRAGKARPLPGFSPDGAILLRVDSFLNQDVICFEGDWIRRIDVIKYIANVAHGIHSGTVKEYTERLIRRVRHVWRMSMENDVPKISANVDAFSIVELPVILDRKSIDCVLIEVFASASLLVNSPDVKALQELVVAEMKARS